MKKASLANQQTFAVADPGLGGRTRYISVAPVGDAGWRVFVGRDKDSILKGESSFYIQVSATVFLLFVSIVLLLAFLRKVEDNSDDVELTIRALKKNNILNTMVIAKDGVEALDYLFGTGTYAWRNVNEQPVVVLLDLKLPRINGLEVLKAIRQNEFTRFLPVVILTSSLEEQDKISGCTLGANSYVRKPVDFAQFTEAIKTLGLYWLIWNEPAPVAK